MMRQAGTPGARADLSRMNKEIDVRGILPAIRAPTLVMNRTEDHPTNVGGSRYLAEHIAGARHVELPGADHAPMAGDAEPVLAELQMFLEEAWAGTRPTGRSRERACDDPLHRHRRFDAEDRPSSGTAAGRTS